MILQKTFSLFSQAYIQATCLTRHENVAIYVFILLLMASHSFLLKLKHVGWDLSAHGWFMRFSLAWSTVYWWGEERSLTITLSTNQSFYQKNLEI